MNFCPAKRMLEDAPPVFYPDRYDEHGKWMDGWETRRRRGSGNDHCILQLGAKGIIAGFDLNTRFFRQPSPARSHRRGSDRQRPDDSTEWVNWCLSQILPGFFQPVRHLGRSRLQLPPPQYLSGRWHSPVQGLGNPSPNGNVDPDENHELSAIINGGRVVGYNAPITATPGLS